MKQAAVILVALLQAVSAFAQMPDPKQMSGKPLPVGDLTPGTVTARVFRGQLSNPLAGQTVELTGAGAPILSKTDAAGRATFTSLTPGTRVKTAVTVDGERIESQEFEIPSAGGIRLMLVATDASAPKPAAEPAVAGAVTFGQESRFVIEIGDDALNVFNIMQIVNPGAGPVQTAPLVFDLPVGAVGVGVLDGSSKSAVAAGRKVTVTGPFAPGNTLVQFAYSLPLGDPSIAIEQKLPAGLPQLSVIAQKLGAMQLASPQITQRREMAADGNTYIVGQGGALRAGDTVSFTRSAAPARPSWPRNVAIALAAVILAAGVWAATRRWAGRRPRAATCTTSAKTLRRARLARAQRARIARRAACASRRESLVTAQRISTGVSTASRGPVDFTSLQLIDVTRTFGRRRALNRVSLTAGAGVTALPGHNGAGSHLLSLPPRPRPDERPGALRRPRVERHRVRRAAGRIGIWATTSTCIPNCRPPRT